MVKDAARGEQTLVEIKRQLLQVTQELAAEQEHSEGLASDSRALCESSKEMNGELERLEVKQSMLRTDSNIKKQRLSETQSELDHTTYGPGALSALSQQPRRPRAAGHGRVIRRSGSLDAGKGV